MRVYRQRVNLNKNIFFQNFINMFRVKRRN
ncbi:hypothetical protein FWK35_00025570 [Aphis craccivora]|uniref:Uncharacterized protein n=1 Tax=Aphis craccivora TaxID=307492 RepID=A0A6G0ZB41_APHCR|nr:hypothetical protein FWK35_00025570 [Aphis craccivora]